MHSRPETLEVLARRVVKRTQVIDESVGPDVGDLLGVPGNRYPPRLGCAADRKVAETALDEAARLVVAELRQHEVGLLVVDREQSILIRGQTKEPVPFLDPLRHGAVIRALAVDELVF
jgi:hypothetical protein